MSELSNILKIIEQLEKEQVDFIIIGGMAVILYGMPRTSEDLDILVKMKSENIQKIRNALSNIFSDSEIKEITFNELKNYAVIRYISPDNDIIDIVANLGEAFHYENIEFKEMEIEGIKVKVATPKALINMKSSTYREKDKLDLLFLKELIKKNASN